MSTIEKKTVVAPLYTAILFANKNNLRLEVQDDTGERRELTLRVELAVLLSKHSQAVEEFLATVEGEKKQYYPPHG